MGGEPDQHVLAHLLTHPLGRVVVLAHVHAVGLAAQGQVGPVVQPEERSVLVAPAPEEARRGQQVRVARLLVPELDHVHPALERRGQQRVEAGAEVRDEVQPRAGQPLAAHVAHGLKVDDPR